MAHGAHTQDLIKKALADVGELPDGSSGLHSMALEAMNTHYLSFLSGANEFDIDCGDPFTWARSATPKSFLLYPIYEAGTVSVTNAGASGTFSTAPSSTLGSFVNRYLKVQDRPTFYRITAHTAGAAAFTIEREYIEATAAAIAFQAIPALYDVGSKILRLVEPFRCFGNFTSNDAIDTEVQDGKIWGMEANAFRRDYPLHMIDVGLPSRFATIRRNESSWLVEVNACPLEVTKVDLDWVEIPAGLMDSSESVPLLPREFRKALNYATSFTLAIHKGIDKRTQLFYDLTQKTLRSMVKAENRNTTHSGKNKGRMLARQEQLNARNRNRNGYV